MCRDQYTKQMYAFERPKVTSMAKIKSDIAIADKGAVTLGNFSCNLSRNFVATQVARCDTGCLNRVTLGNVSRSFWKLS